MYWLITRILMILILILLYCLQGIYYVLLFSLLIFTILVIKLIRHDFTFNVEWNNTKETYYIYAPCLFLNRMCKDDDGIVIVDYGRHGKQYNPAYIGWYGLLNINEYYRTKKETNLDIAILHAKWLKINFKDKEKFGYTWEYNFDRWENNTFLRKPWHSSMSQGLCISLLLRIGEILNDKEMLQIAERASYIFMFDINNGGLKHEENHGCIYEEYPAYPLTKVLDGNLFALLGLYDLYKFTNKIQYHTLFLNGVRGIETIIENYNYRSKWSLYGIGYNILTTDMYNSLNCALLNVVSCCSGSIILRKYANLWSGENLKMLDKVEIGLFRLCALELLTFKTVSKAILRRIV